MLTIYCYNVAVLHLTGVYYVLSPQSQVTLYKSMTCA